MPFTGQAVNGPSRSHVSRYGIQTRFRNSDNLTNGGSGRDECGSHTDHWRSGDASQRTFDTQQVNLQTPATRLVATGQFSFDNDSNLTVDLNSSDAELQAVLISLGTVAGSEKQMTSYGVAWQAIAPYQRNIRGRLSSPNLNGKVSVGTLIVNGSALACCRASIAMNKAEIRIPDGALTERDGGGVQFSLIAPRNVENSTSECHTRSFQRTHIPRTIKLHRNKQLTSATVSDMVISGQA